MEDDEMLPIDECYVCGEKFEHPLDAKKYLKMLPSNTNLQGLAHTKCGEKYKAIYTKAVKTFCDDVFAIVQIPDVK